MNQMSFNIQQDLIYAGDTEKEALEGLLLLAIEFYKDSNSKPKEGDVKLVHHKSRLGKPDPYSLRENFIAKMTCSKSVMVSK